MFGLKEIGGFMKSKSTEAESKAEERRQLYRDMVSILDSARGLQKDKPVVFTGTKDNHVGIDQAVAQHRYTKVNSPTSYRLYDVKQTTQGLTGKLKAISSTAVKSVQYDPESQICQVVFRGGDEKEYSYSMTPKEFEQFMNSYSKGRYVNNTMKYQNRIKHWKSLHY